MNLPINPAGIQALDPDLTVQRPVCCNRTVAVYCAGCPHASKTPASYPNGPIGSSSLRMAPEDADRLLASPQAALRKPKLLIIGYARHGKDTVAELLRDHHGFTFASSSYFAAEHTVRPAMAACGKTYDTLEACYADRVNHRAFWYEAISLFNNGGRSRLAEAILVDHDIYVGMRSNAEYQASRDLFDLVVWVDASRRGLPPEDIKSNDIAYDPKTMNLIDNGGSLEELEAAVDAFARLLSWAFPKA